MKNKAEILNVLHAPLITEKSTNMAGSKACYAFRVGKKATKFQIKAAVELAFTVVVDTVRTCTVKPKKTRFGKVNGQQSGWKKAYVTLASGHSIDMSS